MDIKCLPLDVISLALFVFLHPPKFDQPFFTSTQVLMKPQAMMSEIRFRVLALTSASDNATKAFKVTKRMPNHWHAIKQPLFPF
jgi:hypothetical protein